MPNQKPNNQICKRFNNWQGVLIGCSSFALVILAVLFLPGCSSLIGYSATPSQIQIENQVTVPSVSSEALFYFSENHVYAFSEGESVLIAPDVLAAAMLKDGRLLFSKAGEEQTHFWVIDLTKDIAEPIFSLTQGQGEIIPSPDGLRVALRDILTGEIFIYTIADHDLQRITTESSQFQWSPDGRALIFYSKGNIAYAQLQKDGSFEAPKVVAQGVESPIAFIDNGTILFQKRTVAPEESEVINEDSGQSDSEQPGLEQNDNEQAQSTDTSQHVFTFAKLSGETIEEFESFTSKTAFVTGKSDGQILFYDPAHTQAKLLSTTDKKIILTIPDVTQAVLSTDGATVLSVKQGGLYNTNIKTQQEELLLKGVERLIPSP